MPRVPFSSPGPSCSHGELIVYPCSGVRRSRQQFQTSFPRKPLCQSKPNFMWTSFSHWEGANKVYINASGHMTKMAAMLKNVKTLKKPSPEPLGQLT